MTTEIVLWLVGYGITGASVLIISYIKLSDKIAENNMASSNRFVKIETTIELLGLNSAKFLHRDDDLFKMDDILDKYIDRHYEMSPPEWNLLLVKCEQVKNDESVDIFYRFMAGQLAAICHHKLMHTPTDDMRSANIKPKRK